MKERDLIYCPRCTPPAGRAWRRPEVGECALCEDNGVIKEDVAAAYRLGGLRAAIACPLCYNPAEAQWRLARWEHAMGPVSASPYRDEDIILQPNQLLLPCLLHPHTEAPPPSVAHAFLARGWEGVEDLVGVMDKNIGGEAHDYMVGGAHQLPTKPLRLPQHVEILFSHPTGLYTYDYRY
jgi:hypothetical protein